MDRPPPATFGGQKSGPVVKAGRICKKKPPVARRITIEEQIQKEQKNTEVSCSKKYFAK